MTSNQVHTPLVPVERTQYNGSNMLRDPIDVVDPEALEIIKQVNIDVIYL